MTHYRKKAPKLQLIKIMPASALSILNLKVENDLLTAAISDGRIVSIPIAWFSRLIKATEKQLANFEISPSGYGIHWPDLDEDISIKAFVMGSN